ncbi:MAG: 2-oxoacid:ferredoxin oxidoreductase subunit beta [Acidobacteria bacterium]|nr:2-oxoacid:ferredoxin oxidoreductase subunit beta [Acidobacteriota bacterium]
MSILVEIPVQPNPVEAFIRDERMPHVWCPGCGIGTTVNCFSRALLQTRLNLDRVVVVSGIGCTGRVAGYLNLTSFHTTHGRAIPFAAGMKMANPDLNVVVYSGDGDLTAIGGNHFIHAARRNLDLKVICVNNFTYGMTGGQVTPTTPETAVSTTTPYGCFDEPFNLPFLAESAGAAYVARWTAFHVRQVTHAMGEILRKKGFCFLEIICGCPTLYLRRNRLGDGLEAMKYFKENSVVRHGANTKDVGIGFKGPIIVGKFVDIERPVFLERMNQQLARTLDAQYAGCAGDNVRS